MCYAMACVVAACVTIYIPTNRSALDWLGTLAMLALGAAIVAVAVILFFAPDHAPEHHGLE